MIAFGNLWFFLILAVAAVPAIVLGLLGRRIKYYGMAATLAIVIGMLIHTPEQGAAMAGFLVFQVVLLTLHLRFIRTRGRKVVWERRLAAALALAPLVAIKLTGVFDIHLLGFIGVSYFTFRAVQMVIEISDGLITQVRILDTLYFLAFFPVVLSGPIDRSRRFGQDADLGFGRVEYSRLLSRGLTLLALGALYKFVIAWRLGTELRHLDRPPPHHDPSLPLPALEPGQIMPYMYLYGLNLFFDFAGYSHMAVGASYLFGIRTPSNFRLPFLAENIKDFWNRWHITLSFWMRDFVYTRLLMALIKRKVFVSRERASHVAYLVNMTLMGLWHGLTLYYVLYGVYHGLLMVANDLYERHLPWHDRWKDKLWYRITGIIVTFHLVMFGFLIFSGRLVRV